MNLRSVCLLFVLSTQAAFVVAQEQSTPTAPNGCGTGWNQYFVPDSIPLIRCDFRASCDSHDICYGKCESSFEGLCEYRRCRKGGDLYQDNRCKTDERLLHLQVEAGQRRLKCDNRFYEQLRNANKNKHVCEAFAVVYRGAVKNWGEAAFAGAARFKGPPQSQDQYEGALREFFVKGTEEQFRRFVEASDARVPTVDLTRPIKYDADKGLVNVPY